MASGIAKLGVRAPWPRGIEDTRPDHISSVRNVETLSRSGALTGSGRPTVRRAESRGGKGRPRSERRRPKGSRKAGYGDWTLIRSTPYNWPHTRVVLGPKGS